MERRPVVLASRVVGALVLVLNGLPPLLLEFEVIDWTARQLGAYTIFLNVLLAAASAVLGVRVERLVTPVTDPKDNLGNTLVPAIPPNPTI